MEQQDEVLKNLVLRAVADDYESLEKISEDIYLWASERSLKVGPRGILNALKDLIGEDYVRSYFLSAGPPGSAEMVSFDENKLHDLWFYVTPRGKKRVEDLNTE